MASQRSGSGDKGGLSFFGMVGGVMALLKVKDKYDQYKQASMDDEEGRVALASPSVENLQGPGIALLDTEIPASMRRSKPKKGCCMCCGMDCTLFWKAVGIVAVLWGVYLAFKTIRWAMTDSPTGLEGMPKFNTSLGCLNPAYTYNSSTVHVSIPLGTRSNSSSFDIRGGSVGTITIADGAADATEIKYDITIRATQEDLLGPTKLNFVYPDMNPDDTVSRSRLIIDTPQVPSADESSCMRYDVKMYVPPNLKKMHVQAHAVAHVQFAPGTRATMDQLKVTLFALNQLNLLVPSTDVAAKTLGLEVYRGWLVGEAQIVDNLTIETQRWDAIANVKISAAAPADPSKPGKAVLSTATGAGRADFIYLGSKEVVRSLSALHTSSRNADMYLTYRGSGFSGKIDVETKSYTITGAQRIKDADDASTAMWTHFYGDPDGDDEISINSRGWVGLYF